MRSLALAAAGLTLALGAGTAAAEINLADSIEWTTADAELVVHGTIARYSPWLVALPGSSPRAYQAKVEIDVAVIATLKGGDGLGPSFRLDIDRPDTLPASWTDGTDELIIFLELDERTGRLEPRQGEWLVGLGGAAPTPVYTADFGVLRDAKDVLDAVRAAAASKATGAHRVDVPWGTPAATALYAGSAVWLTLPVDATLEKLALTWIADPNVSTREEGAHALVHFRSDANIAVLTRLLADRGFATVTESGKPPVRRYLVRKMAHEVLDVWGVVHRTPVVDVPVPVSPRGGDRTAAPRRR